MTVYATRYARNFAHMLHVLLINKTKINFDAISTLPYHYTLLDGAQIFLSSTCYF